MRLIIFAFPILFIVSTAQINDLKVGYKSRINHQSSNYPDSFDVSEKWPECKDVFNDIQIQGNCSSSWAISVATSIRDRRCVSFGKKEPISAYDLISCCSDCQLDGKNGCNGGDHKSAFEYFINQGIVTGGKYESKTGCKPYPIQPDLKEDSPTSTQCTNSCDVSYKNSYTNDKIKGKGLIPFLYSNQQVMDEIIREGPVVAEFKLYSDFLNYSGGVYQHKTGKLHGYYYAKIIGWGKSEQVEFWRAVASFGPNWGENGTFRIIKGNDECGFESIIIGGVVGGTPDIKSTTTATPEPADIGCQRITAFYNGTFENPHRRSQKFDATFEATADIDLTYNRVYFNLNNYSKTYSENYWYKLFNGSADIYCYTDKKDPCYISFTKLIELEITLKPPRSVYDAELIFLKPVPGEQFTLSNAIGNCATSLKGNNQKNLDSKLYKSCFCCGNVYNPHPSLDCPVSPWS